MHHHATETSLTSNLDVVAMTELREDRMTGKKNKSIHRNRLVVAWLGVRAFSFPSALKV